MNLCKKQWNLEIFLGVGAFDHLKWTYDGAFEQLFSSGRGDLHKNFPKFKWPGRGGGEDVEASI